MTSYVTVVTRRIASLAGALIALGLALAGCGDQPDTSPPGPLGISGDNWTSIIIIAIVVLGGALANWASSRGGRDKDNDR